MTICRKTKSNQQTRPANIGRSCINSFKRKIYRKPLPIEKLILLSLPRFHCEWNTYKFLSKKLFYLNIFINEAYHNSDFENSGCQNSDFFFNSKVSKFGFATLNSQLHNYIYIWHEHPKSGKA